MGKACTRATDCVTASFQSYLRYPEYSFQYSSYLWRVMYIFNGGLIRPILSYLLPKYGSNRQFLGLFRLKVYPWAMPSERLGEDRTSAFREWWC